jgi:hypothetical protein
MALSLAAVSVACGARPETRAVPVAFTAEVVDGGGYVAGCGTGERLVAARPYRLEIWTLPADAPPRVQSRFEARPPGPGGPVVAVACGAGGVRVRYADGAVERMAWGDGARTPIDASTAAASIDATRSVDLGDGRVVVLAADGRSTRRGEALVDWRRAPGGVRHAALDRDRIWAVGDGGLWAWRLTGGAPVAVPLPAGLTGTPLARVFRDGAFLWVETAAGVAHPLALDGVGTRAAGEPVRFGTAARTIRAPVAGGRAEGTVGADRLVLVDADGTRRDLALGGPLEGMLPWSDDVLLVAAGGRLSTFVGGATGLSAPLLGHGEVAALFRTADGRLVVISPAHGFLLGRLAP